MTNPQNDITLVTVIQHMQGMEQRLTGRIDGLEKRFDGLETKVDRNHEEAMRNHTQTMIAIDNIDARLDDLEVVQVPAIKKVVGMK